MAASSASTRGGFVLAARSFTSAILPAAMLLAGAACAQAPMVPAGHYGPPVCSASAPPVGSSGIDTARQAQAEQRQGELDPRAIPSAEPLENFAIARYKLSEYAECKGDNGCYWADLDAQYKRAEGALKVELARRQPGRKLALVMDIDETSLTNYCEMQREDFGYIPSLYRPWETGTASATPIPGALRLFHQARAAGVAVFFITGRPGVPSLAAAGLAPAAAGSAPAAINPALDETAATARNLRAAGFDGWAGLALRNGAEGGMPTIEYKSKERARIAARGYTIVLNVGDQWSDLLGNPQADISVKLPDPFYFLP